MRPAKLSDDFKGTVPVLLHALTWLNDHKSPVDYFCCIYPTAPLIQPQYLLQGFDLIKKKRVTSAFSVMSFPYPIFRALKINDEGFMRMFWPEYENTRSNDLPEAYHDAGQFYWGNTKRFIKEKTFFSSDAIPIILPRYLVQDIDTLEMNKVND